MHLGIDFGTTRTVVAYGDRGNYPVASFLDDTGDPAEWFPSVVAERGGQLRFGHDALRVSGAPEWTVVRSFKRLLSGTDAAPDLAVTVGGTRLRLADLLAGFLAALRDALRDRSNLTRALRRGGPLRAVVATPANAHATQRFLTLEAFRQAGFEVEALMNEPTAAGFEYAHRYRGTLSARREHVVVYDLGGGTFDASLVRMTARHHDVVATAGVSHLGGDDFDAVLAGMALAEVGLDPGALPPAAWSDLIERCREAKEALTPQSRRVTIELDRALPEGPRQVPLSVARFYEACAPLLQRTIEAMRPVMEHLPADGSDTTESPASRELAGIYLVGGGSTLPAVGRALREGYGRRVHRSPYPFAATAMGLAIAADPAAGFQLVDRFSRAFGVFREARDGREVVFDPIIMPDTPLPGPDAPLRIRRVYRAAHNVGHFRFAECRALDPTGVPKGDLVPYGEVRFPFDPALRAEDVDLPRVPIGRTGPGGPLVEEEYVVDAHGLVEVTVADLDTGYRQAVRLGAPPVPRARTERRP